MNEDLSALALPLASVLGVQLASSDPFEKPDQRKKFYKLLDEHGAVEMRPRKLISLSPRRCIGPTRTRLLIPVTSVAINRTRHTQA